MSLAKIKDFKNINRIILYSKQRSARTKKGQEKFVHPKKGPMIKKVWMPAFYQWAPETIIELKQHPFDLMFRTMVMYSKQYFELYPQAEFRLTVDDDNSGILHVYMFNAEKDEEYYSSYVGKQTPFKDYKSVGFSCVDITQLGYKYEHMDYSEMIISKNTPSMQSILNIFVNHKPEAAELRVNDSTLAILFHAGSSLEEKLEELRFEQAEFEAKRMSPQEALVKRVKMKSNLQSKQKQLEIARLGKSKDLKSFEVSSFYDHRRTDIENAPVKKGS